MICIEPIGYPNVERISYLMYQEPAFNINKCFGRFIEQENDAGEVQYLFVIDWDSLTERDIQYISLPGIDLEQHLSVFIRSYDIPYFVQCSSISKSRGDLKFWLDMMHMTYYDRFEFMLRSRAITRHTQCYLGRTPIDFCDAQRVKFDLEYGHREIPNLAETSENSFHPIEEQWYDTEDYLAQLKELRERSRILE